jgi:hypothetical protein
MYNLHLTPKAGKTTWRGEMQILLNVKNKNLFCSNKSWLCLKPPRKALPQAHGVREKWPRHTK